MTALTKISVGWESVSCPFRLKGVARGKDRQATAQGALVAAQRGMGKF